MPSISLKIILDEGAVTRKVKFDSRMTVKEAHKLIKEKVIVPDNGKEYALFLRSADNDTSGVWLEDNRTLDYYMLRDGDSLDYICRVRNLRVRLLDDTVKTLQVDEAKSVGELMIDVCARIGITNYDEYGLCHEEEEETDDSKESEKPATGTLTLRRKQQPKERDVVLEQMSKKLKTDDNVEWLDQHRTLREQGIDSKETLLLKRRLFFSDRNVDSRDPVQLNLLYVQTRDAILNGRHPVTEQQAMEFAGIQCQIHFGDFQETKHKPGFLENLQEYLPEQYSNSWGAEKKILKAYSQHPGLSPLDAKFLYIKTARAMPTYGVTFFLVKEKQKDKKKLVPRLLGINAEAILRLDENTKEILQQWPLTHVKMYHAGKSQTFTLNFGDYSDKEYSVKTQDCHRIRDILEGYIDIIRRRMMAKPSADPGDSMAILHDNVEAGRSHLIEHISNNPSKIVTETFVGPNRILPYDQASQAQSGATITTVQQIVVTDHLQNQQQALEGEIPLRADMSQDCIRKLNRLNSNSVKIVGLLTDPSDVNVKDAQRIVENMQEDLTVVEKGVKETAEKQTIDGARKRLLDELDDLLNHMKDLAGSTKPGQVNPSNAKASAESIADLTTQIYFAIDPQTRRRSNLLRRSRKSFKAGEKTEQTIRRASFIAAATTALHSVDTAAHALNEEYTGPKLDEAERKKLERSLEDRMGKLNAAIALYLTAHSDPENIDYSAAINSMNAINELMPKLARDAQILSSTKDPAAGKELQDEMRRLFDATKKVCGTQDHEKMQEASNSYADIAGKLIFTFARGSNAQKENEIIDLAKDAGAKTSLLLVLANETACQATGEPAAALDRAGSRTADNARDLLACAQLTAPAIHEPHCQSALTAAAEALASSVHHLETSWRPLTELPTRQHMAEPLKVRAADVMAALQRLKDAYAHLGVDNVDDASLPLQERQRLKFITTMSAAKDRMHGLEDLWDKSATGAPSEQNRVQAQSRLEQQLAQLNAAVAALAAATADRENPDFATAEIAASTISELIPEIIRDTEVVSSDKDEATRNAMLKHIRALCEATRQMCEGAGYQHGQGEAASNFAAASGKLVFLISPGADKGKEKYIMELSSVACDKASDLLAQVQRLRHQVDPETAADLNRRGARAADAAQALVSVAQVTAPSINEPRCQDALASAVDRLQTSAADLTDCCQRHLRAPDLQHEKAALDSTHQQLEDSLRKLGALCQGVQAPSGHGVSPQQEKQHLQFISSVAGTKKQLDAADQLLDGPHPCQMMREEDAAVLEHKLSDRLARLNAAVAALAAATADREHPDYVAADRAVNTITELMPLLVQDSRKLCGTKDAAGQAAMIQHLKQLCEATKEICDNAGQPQGVGEAAAKFSAASGKLVFLVSPRADNELENQVIDLSAAACGKTSELLSQVQSLTQQIEPAAAAELDNRGANAADAAQALLTVAQVTAPSITEPSCQKELISAAERLRTSTSELTDCCAPQLLQREDMKRELMNTQQQLHHNLDSLVDVCRTVKPGIPQDASGQQEQRRLKFVSSIAPAKNRLYDAEHQLNQPMLPQPMEEEAAEVLKHQLSQRLAKLNAALAALAAATVDREHPNYVAAERAIKDISEMMPQVVQDSRKLCGSKDAAGQAAMLQHLKQLCEATRELCENADKGVGEAAAKFSAASGKLVFLVSPRADEAQEKQVMTLTAAACGKTSELLSQVQSLTKQVESATAAELDNRGANAADAAQALLTVAQATAPTISDPSCSAALVSSAEKLRTSTSELMHCCAPHLLQRGDMKRELMSTQQQLQHNLDELVETCRASQHDGSIVLSPEKEEQRLKFVSSVLGAQRRLNAVDQLIKEPVICQLLKPADGAAIQHKLRERIARLRTAGTGVAAATVDNKNPDYVAADQAVNTIIELIPELVQDTRTLSGTKDESGQALVTQHLQTMCHAVRDLCGSNGHPKKLHDASLKLDNASKKLEFLIGPQRAGLQQAGNAQVRKPAVLGKKPAVPVREPGSSLSVAHAVPPPNTAAVTQEFLHMLRSEEGHNDEDKPVRTVTSNVKAAPAVPDKGRCAFNKFSQVVDNAGNELHTAEEGIKVLYTASSISSPGRAVPAEEVSRREQLVEDTLAAAGVQVSAIVAANYADKLDYKAALEPTMDLTKSVKSVVDDGSVISGSLHENSRKPFLDDLTGLCRATKHICDSAKSDKEKLNGAAIEFGDRSAGLLRVVSSDINPDLEKEVISRAKAIGDTASRLALEASHVASSTSAQGDSLQHVCTAGASCVDAAGKLVYTAKLVAPTIHHTICQDALVSSADSLSSSLASFSNTWTPLASAQHPNIQKLTEEAENLEKLVEKLRGDVRAGKLGRRRVVDRVVNLDTPLRQMTMQVIDNANKMAEHGEISPELKKEYNNYSSRLTDAIRALDLASARYQRAPHDKKKRNDMEMAIQDLQVMLLQTRPSRVGQEQNYIVDFRDFLQDLVNKADQLQETAKKTEGAAGKRTTDDIRQLCSKISEDANKLLSPEHSVDDVTVLRSVDDVEEFDHFGQECDVLVKEINALIHGVHDQKAKQALRAKALPLTESCHLLRFATNSHISATKSVAYEEVLRDLGDFKTSVMKPIVCGVSKKTRKEKKVVPALLARSGEGLQRAVLQAAGGQPEALCRSLTSYTASAANHARPNEADEVLTHLGYVVDSLEDVTGSACYSSMQCCTEAVTEERTITILKELHDLDEKIAAKDVKVQVLDAEDIDKLLMCDRQKVEGTPMQLQEKVQQLASKLSSTSGTVLVNVDNLQQLATSLRAAAQLAAQLANTARALKDHKRPIQCKRIENAAREMCLATYSLLKTSKLVCQDPNHHDSRRKLLEACHQLNNSINKLVRTVNPGGRVAQECSEVQRGLHLQRRHAHAPPRPRAAVPYQHCVDTLRDQRDLIQKLNNDQAMSRAQFLQSMNYITSAVNNSADCAAHAAYLLSVSETDKSVGKEGIVDVPKLHKAVAAVEDSCVSIIRAQYEEQVQEQTKVLESDVKELLESLDDAIKKTKDTDLKNMLKECRQDVDSSSRELFNSIKNNQLDKQQRISLVMNLMDDVKDAASLIEHPALVPTASKVSADTQARIDEVVKSSVALLTNTEELIKQVKSAPEEPEVMKWVMFSKRKDVLDAFDALLKTIKSTGQQSNLLEGAMEDSEEEKKSYVQRQFDAASKWLLKPTSKADVKTNGQQAVRNLIDVANKITEDLKGNDKEDMRHLVVETEQLLTECCKKYDQEQYSVLMERVRELKKAIERGVVTRVVEDFMEAEAPLEDLDIIADHEKDESKRKFLLEQKIAELLAQLSRVTRTARLIAHTDADNATNITTQLNQCSEQAELLAPMLVKAAQQRVAAPDDKAVIENYQALIAKYAESLSKIRDLCDQSVDPMDFVQTAGETMQRMREESSRGNEPARCARASAAITKLANRVIHVGMSSSTARSDPELQKALTEAKQQLSAATPPADTRASRMPDWKDTTAKILQATEEVESLLGGETIFKKQPETNQPIYNEALNLHVAIRDWSSRDNEIVAVAKRMAVLMAKLSNYMNNDKQREVLATSKAIVTESHEVTRLARKLAHECSDHRIKTNLLQTCERIPTISGQLKMLTTVKGFALGRHGTEEDKEAMDMLVGNAQSLMLSIQDVVKGAASASVKIMSQRGPRMKWVRKTVY